MLDPDIDAPAALSRYLAALGSLPGLPRVKEVLGCVPCMQKLDRLEWRAGFSFISHAARLGIRTNDPAVLPQLQERLPPGSRPSASAEVDELFSLFVGKPRENSGVRPYHLLYRQWGRLARSLDLEQVLDTLESALHFSVAVGAQRRLFVHAGVVGWNGRAIVIPGKSMSGKTALVAALVRAGATYYSDEFAVLDARGRVHPYAKPLFVRNVGTEREIRTRIPAEALGGRTGSGPLPVGLVALTEYRACARWRPRTLSPGEAVLALLEHTVLARVRSELALATLQPVALEAVVLRGRRGEAEAAAPRLLQRLESARPARQPARQGGGRGGEAHGVRRLTVAGRP